MSQQPVCPECREEIQLEANKCSHCASELPEKLEAYVMLILGTIMLPVTVVSGYMTWIAVDTGADYFEAFNLLELMIWGMLIGLLLGIAIAGPLAIGKGRQQLEDYRTMMGPSGVDAFSSEKTIVQQIGRFTKKIGQVFSRGKEQDSDIVEQGKIKKSHTQDQWTFERVNEEPYEHYTNAIDDIRTLQSEGKTERAEKLLLWCIDYAEAEAKAKDRKGLPPAYYTRLSQIYQEQGRYQDETSVLERYVTTTRKLGAEPSEGFVNRLEEARTETGGSEQSANQIEEAEEQSQTTEKSRTVRWSTFKIPTQIWPGAIILGCILWLSQPLILENETAFTIVLFSAWFLLPVSIYFDSRTIRQQSTWNVRWWAYTGLSVIPIIAPIFGLAWLLRKRQVTGTVFS